MTEKENKKKEKKDYWFIKVSIITFILSLCFSYLSTTAISKLQIIPAIIILLLLILMGIIFDIIGVAVTVADEQSFHAKASKKMKGSKTAIKLIRNSPKVANFCADVIGDISGVLSGAVSAIIAQKIIEMYNFSDSIQFIVSALVASMTVGGKAIGKNIAQENCEKIVDLVSKITNIDIKNMNKKNNDNKKIKKKN